MIFKRVLALSALIITLAESAWAQALPDSLLTRVRAGAAGISFIGDSVALPLVGTRTLPLVEVRINGRGPFRLLIDLGSNVTLLRRNVVDLSRASILMDRASTDIVHVDAITLGAATIANATVGAYDSLDVDGVLGYNVLQRTPFTLDFATNRLVLHRQLLPTPDGRTVHAYEVIGRLPYISVLVGTDTIRMNLDTGASEWMTLPPDVQSRLRWKSVPAPGRTTSNNQTGRTRVLEGTLADTLRFGALTVPSPHVFVNPAADDSWIGMSTMAGAIWIFDPLQQRISVRLGPRS